MHNVKSYFEKEREAGGPLCRPDAVLRRTAEATGVSRRTVTNICSSPHDFRTPVKNKSSVCTQFSQIDDFDKEVIRRCIHEFWRSAVLPTVDQVLKRLKDRIDFPYGEETLHKIMHHLGFSYRLRASKYIVMKERSDLVAWRADYLRQMRKLRLEHPEREIVYLDETWINQGYTRVHGWEDTESLKNPGKARQRGLTVGTITTPIGQGKRLMILHAMTRTGFGDGALMIYKGGIEEGDFHKNVDSVMFENWFREQL